MRFSFECVLCATEPYKAVKTGKEYVKALFVQEGSTESITLLTEDFSLMACNPYTRLKCIVNYTEKYQQLKLVSFEPF